LTHIPCEIGLSHIPFRFFHSDCFTMASSPDRVFTTEELAEYNGENGKPIYVAVRDVTCFEISVFDMSSAAMFYGPGGRKFLFSV
jgi:hypothetical protein